ncbi:MAG: glycosyltransferase family 2 protein [candidate division WOR-3 bacterium]
MNIRYSLVVPVYNEAGSVRLLYEEITPVMLGLSQEGESDYELIFVDDGSTDPTPREIAALAETDSRVRLVRLRHNLGKSAAYSAGFAAARGDVIVTLDGDLQDDPRFIPSLLDVLQQGFDLVVGWKQNRLENEPAKTLSSRIFNSLKRLVFGLRLHDSNSGFRAMRGTVARSLQLHGDMYRFIPELAARQGFRVTEIPVIHRRRRFGESKYGPGRFWTGLLDLLSVRFLTGYIHKPLHFFGTLGLLPLLVGLGLEFYVLVRKLFGSRFQTHLAALIIGVLLIMVGVQLIAIGLIGEMIRAVANERGGSLHED